MREERGRTRNAGEESEGFYIPERNLLIAMIERAALDVARVGRLRSGDVFYSHVAKREKEDALRWVNSDSRREFSFVWCCECLGFDVGRIRGLMHKLCVGLVVPGRRKYSWSEMSGYVVSEGKRVA